MASQNVNCCHVQKSPEGTLNIISEIKNGRYLGQDNMIKLLFILFPYKSQKMHIGWIGLMFPETFNLLVQPNFYMHSELYKFKKHLCKT